MKKILKVPLFFHKIELYQQPTLQESVKDANVIVNGLEHSSNALTVYMRKGLMVVLFDETACTPGVIAHEAKHVVNYILKDIGHIADLDNDEFECYLLGWIVDEFHKYLKVN